MTNCTCIQIKWKLFISMLAALTMLGWSQDDYQEGLAAYENKDYGQAINIWRPLAEQGHSEAQFNMGFIYAKGQGVSQDSEISVNWYRKAAAQGHAKAQHNLGLALLKGRGTDIDMIGAVKWLQKSVDQGYAPAQYALGNLSAQGRAVAQDYTKAAALFRKAAEQGHPDAQYRLGISYAYGYEIDKDPKKAEIIGTWDSGIWYRNVAALSWTKIYSGVPSDDIAAGDFTGDKKADVASCWDSGLWYQNDANLGWMDKANKHIPIYCDCRRCNWQLISLKLRTGAGSIRTLPYYQISAIYLNFVSTRIFMISKNYLHRFR